MGQKDHQIILGKGTDETLKLSVKILQRHFACFGSSGSGKTVSSPVNAGTHVSIWWHFAGRPPILLCSCDRILQSFVFR